MNETTKKVPTETEASLQKLRALRDEVRLKAHLGKMEAKQRWHELEARVDVLEGQAAANTAEVSRAVVEDAISGLEKLRDSI